MVSIASRHIVLCCINQDMLARMHRWYTWLWMLASAAIAPALLWASPFGPARDLQSAVYLLLHLYPAWLILTIIWLIPGIVIARRFALSLWWTLPMTAVMIQFLFGAIFHWPPSRWWPGVILGRTPVPTGYAFGYAVEAWRGYFFSLWAQCFVASVSVLSFLAIEMLASHRMKRTTP